MRGWLGRPVGRGDGDGALPGEPVGQKRGCARATCWGGRGGWGVEGGATRRLPAVIQVLPLRGGEGTVKGALPGGGLGSGGPGQLAFRGRRECWQQRQGRGVGPRAAHARRPGRHTGRQAGTLASARCACQRCAARCRGVRRRWCRHRAACFICCVERRAGRRRRRRRRPRRRARHVQARRRRRQRGSGAPLQAQYRPFSMMGGMGLISVPSSCSILYLG